MASRIEALPQEVRQKAKKVEQPSWINPMLAKLTHDYFSDEAWIYERKLDGERVLAFVDDNGRARLMTRNQKRVDDSYPEIQEALEAWAAKGCILDGEVVAFNRKNISDFHKLQQRMHSSSREASRKSGTRVYYYLFDCLYVNGHDITGCPLRGRKKILKSSVTWKDPLRWTQHRNNKGLEYHDEACRKGGHRLRRRNTQDAWRAAESDRTQDFAV
jgi:ATP-dependent DNA ligase